MKAIGPLFVAAGAVCYGLPATLMKLANKQDSNVGNILFFLFLCSVIILFLLGKIISKKTNVARISYKKQIIMALSGISIAITNCCYFLSLSYLPVAVVAVMLMQSVWLAMTLNCLLNRCLPSRLQVIIVLLILFGTLLATNLIAVQGTISFYGLVLSFIAAFSYALTIQATNKLLPELPPIKRASLMSIGAFIIIAAIFIPKLSLDTLINDLKWGAIISIFAMVLPLTCLSFGMPKTPRGIGEIISSLELPAAIIFAWLILAEKINLMQLTGVIIIIIAVILSQFQKK
ncbi:DMT family transporter [Orbus wheelerorum]|uniref:DMT family transporter n=1 Tax=Orbus wheelerorum TaxID=3074111 RepID=UPI00370D082A